MDLRVLEYFLTVADEENISHAAELLHVSQPTISRQLMDLEEELGRKLFIRTNKKVILTDEGNLFRETAEDILKLYNRAKADRTETEELEGEIYIASGEIESFGMIAEKIRSFHLQHPKVLFHIHSGNAEEICAAIDKGTADIGYIVQSVNTMKYEVFSLDTSEKWGILVNKNHRLASKESVSAADLQKENLVVPANLRLRNDIREWTGPRSHVAATYTLIKNAMILTELSDWVTICLETRKYASDHLVFVPFSPAKTSSASLIWKKRTVYSPAMREFLSLFGIQNINSN
jgi:DNA-binding transcriptional LysR family regulator